MAQLKDSVVSGNLRVTDTTLTDTLQVTTIKAPTSSGGTTYGPGTSGQVLKSNGSSVYWTSDSNTDEKVKSTKLAQSTAEASYYPTLVTGAGTAGVSIFDSAKINHTPGTTLAVGNTRLILGNATNEGTADNEEGLLRIYSSGTKYHTLQFAKITNDHITHTFPTTGGTILNTGNYTSYTIPFAKVTGSADADTYAANTGWYDWNTTSGTNMPTENWGILLSKGYPSVQMFLPDTGNAIYLRKKTNASTAGSSWMSIRGTAGVDYNLASFVSSSTLNGYLPLSGGKMTGTIQGTYSNTHVALAGGGIGDYATLDNKNNINISSWNGVSISNGCSSAGTLDQVTFSVNARTGTTQQRGNAILYSESGNSPALIFQRGTSSDGTYDWKLYVTEGHLNFDRNSSGTWTNLVQFEKTGKLYVSGTIYSNNTPVSLDGHTHNYLPIAGGTMEGNISFKSISGNTYPIASNKIIWNGGTDGIDIYYNLRASDAGELIMNMRDDTNVRISFAYNGTVKSYIDTNGNFSGNAATSSSWATARTLTLGGQLAGSVSVKGDANMTLKGYLDRAFIYDDNAVPANHTWAEYAWHKFAEVTITTTYTDCVITFLVSRTYSSSAENAGILSAKLRTKGSKDYDSAQLKWLVRNSGLSKDDFVMVYTSTSGTSTKAELWCRLPEQYSGLIFTVLKGHKRQYSTDTSWTLVKTPDGTGSTHGSSSYPTTGITGTIISSDGTITNSTTGTANRATYLDVVSSNEIRFYNDNQFKANNQFWIGYSWAAGSHYTPSGGSDTSSTTAPNITKFIMGNCSAGGLASVHAKTFILGNGSSPTHTSKTTTIATAATTTDRTITLPDASGTLGVAEILFNTPTNSTDPVSLSSTPLSDYNYFTIIFSMNGANSNNSSSAIVPAVEGKHFALFRVNETTEYMMFPITIIISTYGNATAFATSVNRGISIPYSGSSVSIVSARTAYIKMIIGHKS